MKRVVVTLLMMTLILAPVFAEDFSNIKKRVSEFTLPNGLKFILLEDHSAPVASFVTYVNAGGSDERIGIWGISHFLEHLAFKGTTVVGTKNWKAEKKVMAKMDAVFSKLRFERNSVNPDKTKIKQLEAELEKLQKEAAKHVVPNEFDAILKRNGGVGLNAGTGYDSTVYFFSLPSNKLELWAYLESTRFTDPTFREFYKEREVIKEERRVRTENNPIGKMIEEVLGVAFKNHPYGVSLIGPMSNIGNYSRSEVKSYFMKNYTASNMVIGVAGDITPAQLKKVAKKYFSGIRRGSKNQPLFTKETKQPGEKTITMYEDSQPLLALAYHAPAYTHKDYTTMEVMNYILATGRSSRLYKKMVIDKKNAMVVQALGGFPGTKYPGLYLIFTLPNSGHKNSDLYKDIIEELDRLKKEPVTKEELASAKLRMKVAKYRSMGSDMGLLRNMLSSEIVLGSWEKAFDGIKEIEAVTAEDIQKFAEKYLTNNNRIVAKIEKKVKKEVKK